MNSSEIRKHLKKGELAVALLESLGYVYEDSAPSKPPRWSGEDTVKGRYDDLLSEIAKHLPKPEPVKVEVPVDPDIRVGDRFVINTLPKGHHLRSAWPPFGCLFTVDNVQWIAAGTPASQKLDGFHGFAVNFRYFNGLKPVGLWLPLSCIRITEKTTRKEGPPTNADF
ncbi:hypothetical protein GV819_15890 [Pseudomonas sp. Fl5BN2]|uniref:hypothetical protein n=1 Tax=Pseudomonas sp. Fl5BN2 TaxID=2697652 RepID=UPI0013782834|nr:hypothetical protein [Pseudomonas sp. Fl5BN2]NBF03775.1 hypothetical protein [Pseudomonas sp. Fl5BN2]